MKILLTGPNGFVGHKLLTCCENMVPCPSLRNADEDTVRRIVDRSGCDAILHTAAISDIPTCDRMPEESRIANVQLPVFLARAAEGRKLVCFSSDQVYCGNRFEGPYTEADTAPGNLYARQKLEMEERVLDIDPNAVMLRAEWMYDYGAVRDNYLMNVLKGRLAYCPTQYRGVTYLQEVADNIPAVMKLSGGAYNFGSETTRNMVDITNLLLEMLGQEPKATCSDGDRHNLWMDCSKAAKQGVAFSEVVEGLRHCLTDYKLI